MRPEDKAIDGVAQGWSMDSKNYRVLWLTVLKQGIESYLRDEERSFISSRSIEDIATILDLEPAQIRRNMEHLKANGILSLNFDSHSYEE